MYKVNRNSLEKAIEATIRRAHDFGPRDHSGECQLYGRVNKEGVVESFFIADMAGHNSWIEREGVVPVFTQRWFDVMANEDLEEWFKGELDQDKELRNRFVEYLQNEGITGKPEEYWWKFQNFNDEKWKKMMDEWTAIALEHYIPDRVRDAIDRLASDEWDISEEYPIAEIE
ncbi:hypothetical protein BSNK01_12120 [Bacillaceae bacterium]